MLRTVLPALLVTVPALALSLRPVEGSSMLVYAPLAQGQAAGVLARADARLVRSFSRDEFMVVADSSDQLASRLYAAGATLVLFYPQRAGCPI